MTPGSHYVRTFLTASGLVCRGIEDHPGSGQAPLSPLKTARSSSNSRRMATYMLILSELHCNNPDSAYIHQSSYIFALGLMSLRLRMIQRMRIELAMHDGTHGKNHQAPYRFCHIPMIFYLF